MPAAGLEKPLRGIFSAGKCTEKTDLQGNSCRMTVPAAPRSVGRARKEVLGGGIKEKKTTKKEGQQAQKCHTTIITRDESCFVDMRSQSTCV